MDVKEFREIISKQFGGNLENATPGNTPEFLDDMQVKVLGPHLKGRFLLEEGASSYEEIMKDFFTSVLELPKDEALVMLWLLAFDLVFSQIESHQAEKLKSLFGDHF